MKMPKSPPFTAVLSGFILAVGVLIGSSCTEQPKPFRLRVRYEPAGKIVRYKMETHRVGSVSSGDKLVREIDVKTEGDIYYITQEMLPDSTAAVREKYIWTWDERADDTSQLVRKTREFNYDLLVTPLGKVNDLKMVDAPHKGYEDYARAFSQQGVTIFPDEEVSVGYQWTQTTSVALPGGDIDTASTVYKIKGSARKMGYECAIIEYSGNLVLPIFRVPADTLKAQGVDWIEMTGILYFARDAGIAVSSEERRRVVSDREYLKNDELVYRKAELEEMISYYVVSVDKK